MSIVSKCQVHTYFRLANIGILIFWKENNRKLAGELFDFRAVSLLFSGRNRKLQILAERK